jgi:hypothetical protein
MGCYGPDEIRITVWEEGSRVWVRWKGDAFESVKMSFRAAFPRHGDAIYSGEARAWSLPLGRQRRLEDWSARTCDPACIHRISDPGSRTHSSSSGGYQYHCYQHPPAPVSPLEQAYARLHLLPSAPPEVVTAAYHALVRLYHPDVGGDHDRTVAINAAAALIREHLERSA